MIDFEKKEVHLGEWCLRDLAIAIEAIRSYPQLDNFKIFIDGTDEGAAHEGELYVPKEIS